MNWNNWLLENEIILRLSFFFGIFAIVALWEWRAPRRTLLLKKSVRWFNNLLIIFINSLILRLIFPTAAVGIAFLAQQNNWGFFNVYQTAKAVYGFTDQGIESIFFRGLGAIGVSLAVTFWQTLFLWRKNFRRVSWGGEASRRGWGWVRKAVAGGPGKGRDDRQPGAAFERKAVATGNCSRGRCRGTAGRNSTHPRR
jgi:hypothetical protein